MQLPDESTELLSAALRHVRDAEHLLAPGPHQSSDQAFHLAGYGPECARKATLALRHFDKLLGHDLTTAAEKIVDIAVALDPIAHRYRSAWSERYPAFSNWNEQVRYKRTGTCDTEEARALIHAARSAVDGIALALWADGRLEAIP